MVGRGGGGEVARGDGRGSGGWGGGGGRWSTKCRGGNDAASRCWRRRVTRRWRVPEPGAATAPLDRPKHEPHATLHGRWRPSRTDGPNEVNRAEHRPSDGRRCSACQVPTPETRTRAPLARSTHPCSRAVCRSNELVLANDQVEETGVALMVTGALTDCSSALPAHKDDYRAQKPRRRPAHPSRNETRPKSVSLPIYVFVALLRNKGNDNNRNHNDNNRLDLSTSSGGRGAATTRVAMRTMARAWASAPSWKQRSPNPNLNPDRGGGSGGGGARSDGGSIRD